MPNEMTIWKFMLGPADVQAILLAKEAEVLTAQTQHGSVQVWVRTPKDAILPEYPLEPRRFFMHGTGHDVHPDAGRYIGTCQFQDGALVFHVFEERR